MTEGPPVVKQSGQGTEQMRNRSPLPGTKDLKCVPLPQVEAALSLALTGDYGCVAGQPKLSRGKQTLPPSPVIQENGCVLAKPHLLGHCLPRYGCCDTKVQQGQELCINLGQCLKS